MGGRSTAHRALKASLAVVVCLMAHLGSIGCQQEPSLLETYRRDGVPFVTNMSPTSGGTGVLLTITGENFGASQGDGRVSFYGGTNGGAVNASIEHWSTTEIKCRVPALAVNNTKIPWEIVRSDGVKAVNLNDFTVP